MTATHLAYTHAAKNLSTSADFKSLLNTRVPLPPHRFPCPTTFAHRAAASPLPRIFTIPSCCDYTGLIVGLRRKTSLRRRRRSPAPCAPVPVRIACAPGPGHLRKSRALLQISNLAHFRKLPWLVTVSAPPRRLLPRLRHPENSLKPRLHGMGHTTTRKRPRQSPPVFNPPIGAADLELIVPRSHDKSNYGC